MGNIGRRNRYWVRLVTRKVRVERGLPWWSRYEVRFGPSARESRSTGNHYFFETNARADATYFTVQDLKETVDEILDRTKLI